MRRCPIRRKQSGFPQNRCGLQDSLNRQGSRFCGHVQERRVRTTGVARRCRCGQEIHRSLLEYQNSGGDPSFDMLVRLDDVPVSRCIWTIQAFSRFCRNAVSCSWWGPEDARDDRRRELFLLNAANETHRRSHCRCPRATGSGIQAGVPKSRWKIQRPGQPNGLASPSECRQTPCHRSRRHRLFLSEYPRTDSERHIPDIRKLHHG